MEDTIQLLKQINWVLEPISDFVFWFFTTQSGLSTLLTLFVLYYLITISYTLYTRRLLHRAAKSYGGGKVSFFEQVYLIVSVSIKISLQIISKLPVLLGVFIMLFVIAGFSKSISAIDTYVSNELRIKELSSLVLQLDRSYKVAEVEVEDVTFSQTNDIKTTMNIKFFDYATMEFSPEVQRIVIDGNMIYFDALVLNFEYTEIAQGKLKNLVLPYRVFSNRVAQVNGIPLNVNVNDSVPLVFKRNPEEIYGLSEPAYNQRLVELFSYFTDTEKARAAGIRSSYGSAVHLKVFKGQKFSIHAEQTGGIVLKEVNF
ncbi:MAG TPA: hypothetical protein DCQ31_17735 [Bacteroidales bacterium]|nr:hypothetical protein [Bacteroidales bacterium]